MSNSLSPPTTLLISSKLDPAGTNIHDEVMRILPNYPELLSNVKNIRFSERLIYLDGPSLPSDIDKIVFLSRHSSREPRPVLTVHVTGNFGPAEYGGEAETLTPSATGLMHAILNRMEKNAPPGYEVMYEATHHGPTRIPVPSCFAEIGSTETEWNDKTGAASVAKSVLEALMADTSDLIPLAGFGGTHYAIRQTEIAKMTRGSFGHIMPTRDIRHLNPGLFKEIITCTKAEAVYLDGKALSTKEEREIVKMAGEMGLNILSQSDLMQISGLPFSQYCYLQRMAEEISPGLRIVIHSVKGIKDPIVIGIEEELIEEVIRKVPDEFLLSLDSYPVIHIKGGGKVCHRWFITDKENSEETKEKLIYLCISFLQREYDTSFDGDYIVVRKSRFDPKKAAKYNIPAGPLYGDLMRGKSVTVNDREIQPEMVMTEVEKRISIRGNS